LDEVKKNRNEDFLEKHVQTKEKDIGLGKENGNEERKKQA